MVTGDTLRDLAADFEHRRVDRRTFIHRATALGMSARAIGAVLAGAGVAMPMQHALAAQQHGGTMTFAVSTDPETLDPQVTSNGAAWTVFNYIYSPLVFQDLDLSYKGLLADNWTVSPDNLSITFNLHDGITFQDGTPFTAEAVKSTFERLQQVGTKSPIYEQIKLITKMDVKDPKTITLTFSEPSATFFHDISDGYGGILSPTAVQKAGADYGQHPVGSNAYMLKNWQTGSLVTLGAFSDLKAVPGYYTNKGAPFINEVAFKVIPEAFSQVASLESGEIDAVDLSGTDFPRFEHDDRFQIFSSKNPGIEYLGLTSTRPLMSDVKVRTAIAHAIDRDEIVNTLYAGGLAEPVYTALPPSIQGYSQELADSAPHFDLEQSKALFTEAGWTPGKDGIWEKSGQAMKPVLYTTTDTGSGQLATLIQAQLRKAGVGVDIKQLELATLLDFTPKGEHDMLLLSYGWSDPDALRLFLSSTRLKASNRAHYSNPEFDKLVEEGRRTLDPHKRMQIYFEAQKLLIQDQPWVPLFMQITKTAVAKRVQGVTVFPTGGLLLNDASIKS